MYITEARVVVDSHCTQDTLDEVASRLMDSLLLLERSFGNLDELDIDTSSLPVEEKR
jgi:hypothetical protein